MTRVLVTGASGFIGWACLPRLVRAGHEVHAITRQTVSTEAEGVQWHMGDLLSDEGIDDIIHDVRPAHCLHLAWTTEPGRFWTSEENLDWVAASLRLVRSFTASGGHRIVIAGSCTEYMDSNSGCDETTLHLMPHTLYGRSKYSLHLLLDALANQSGMELAWGRVFYPYGPEQEKSRIVPTTIQSLLNNEPATCRTPRQVCDFIHVDDVAEAFVRLMESDAQGCFNISTGTGHAVEHVVRKLATLLGRDDLVSTTQNSQGVDGVLTEWVGQPRRMLEECAWQPRIDLEQGLEQTVHQWLAREVTSV